MNLPTPQIFLETGEPEAPQEKKLNRLLIFSAVILAFIAGYVWVTREPKKAPVAVTAPKLDATTEMMALAKRNKDIGFYDKALMMYERAIGPNNFNAKVKYELIPLFLLDSKNFQKAQDMIKELSEDPKSVDFAPKLANWSGLLLIRKNEYSQAEVELRSASERYSNVLPIQINRVVNFYLAGQYESALKLARTLSGHGSKSPLVTITQGLSMLSIPQDKFVAAEAKDLLADLGTFATTRKDFTFECNLLSAALYDKLGNPNGVIDYLERLVEQTAGITHLFIRDLDTESNVVSWSHLKPLCDSIYTRYGRLPKALALHVQCEIENENLAHVETELQSDLQRFPADQYLLGLKATLTKLQGKSHEAKEALKNVRTRPGLLLRSQLCLDEKDIQCAEEVVRILSEKDRNDIENIYQLTQLNLLKDKRDFAGQFAEKGLKMAPNFRPLVEIREEMGEL